MIRNMGHYYCLCYEGRIEKLIKVKVIVGIDKTLRRSGKNVGQNF